TTVGPPLPPLVGGLAGQDGSSSYCGTPLAALCADAPEYGPPTMAATAMNISPARTTNRVLFILPRFVSTLRPYSSCIRRSCHLEPISSTRSGRRRTWIADDERRLAARRENRGGRFRTGAGSRRLVVPPPARAAFALHVGPRSHGASCRRSGRARAGSVLGRRGAAPAVERRSGG